MIVVVVLMIIFVSWRFGVERVRQRESVVERVPASARGYDRTDAATDTSPPASVKSSKRRNREILMELRQTYLSGEVVPRIRLQGELADSWQAVPPRAEEFVREIADKGAPTAHRIFVAQSFRNLAKSNRLETAQAADVIESIVSVVADEEDDLLVRGQLAVVVAVFDKSPQAVQEIGRLLQAESDEVGLLAVTALRNMSTEASTKALLAYLEEERAGDRHKPRAASAALFAIAGKLDIAPIAEGIIERTLSAEMVHGTLVSLARAPSSVPIVRAILRADDRAATGDFGEQSANLAIWVRQALAAHRRLIEESAPPQTSGDHGVILRAKALLHS